MSALKTSIYAGILFTGLLGTTFETSCKKSRLFSHLDSIASTPPQFHFFNSFPYSSTDSSLALSVDGLFRENVRARTFSRYYPFANSATQGSSDQSVKLLVLGDPAIPTRLVDSLAVQLRPNTSYDFFVQYTPYVEPNPRPKSVVKPHLTYVAEEPYHPYPGTCRIRLINLAGLSAAMSVRPNQGSGTTLSLSGSYSGSGNDASLTGPLRSVSTFGQTKPGDKTISLRLGNIALNFRPTTLEDGRAYSFIAVGDAKNYPLAKEPNVRMMRVEEGRPETLEELKLASVSFTNSADDVATVRVEDGAFNIPGVLGDGAYGGTSIRLNSIFNNTRMNYWKIDNPVAPWLEATGVRHQKLYANKLVDLLGFHTSRVFSVAPGPVLISLQPDVLTQPLYGQINTTVEAGKAYTVFMAPIPGNSTKCIPGIVENDLNPELGIFKLRIINLMPDVRFADLHKGSPSGEVVLSDIQFGVPTSYASIAETAGPQDFFLTASGSQSNLFASQPDPFFKSAIRISTYGGNNATLYMMGTLNASSIFLPIIEYRRDAFIDASKTLTDRLLLY